jgi:acetoin:2,6-dichlorophenolindophenol oxidoreductase subunit beta
MAHVTFAEAIASCLAEEMAYDSRVCVIGQEVGVSGGIHGATRGLLERFGPARVRDMPISESAILGATAGAAMTGLRPVAEIMHSGLLAVAWDLVVNQIAKARYLSGGQITMPLVIRTANGGGDHTGPQLAQNVESWGMAIPGLKVVIPSSPREAKGLLTQSIREEDPVLFLEHKSLYRVVGDVPAGELVIPLGRAADMRAGRDVTAVAVGAMVPRLLAAAAEVGEMGIDVNVIDMRTLVPLDARAVIESVGETGRLVIVEENPQACGWGAELAYMVTSEVFNRMKAPVVRVAARQVPVPASPALEAMALPGVERIVNGVLRVVHHQRRQAAIHRDQDRHEMSEPLEAGGR